MGKILRRQTPSVNIGELKIGSSHAIAVQSMTDTPTADPEATFQQTLELIEAGSEMVRWTINDDQAAKSAVSIIRRLRSCGVHAPIIGDFHFNGHIILAKNDELASLLDKYRINPGNIGKGRKKDDNFATMIKVAIKYKKAVRIGVNWGSLDKEILSAVMDANARSSDPKDSQETMYQAVIDSALQSSQYALDLGLSKEQLVVSAKLSSVRDTIEVYQRLAKACDFALHVGLTEAGGGVRGVAATSAALSILLQAGIGDTIRSSLTSEPGSKRTKEVEVCREILQALGLRYFMPSLVSCPGCGRTESVYFQQLTSNIRQYITSRMSLWKKQYPGVERLKIAVMGCVVNGPGESQHADIGISLPGAFEEPIAPVYIDGKKAATLKGETIEEDFITLLEAYIEHRFKA